MALEPDKQNRTLPDRPRSTPPWVAQVGPGATGQGPPAGLRRGAIVLGGGRSRRMGRDKASLPFGPAETMLQRVVRLVGQAVPAEQVVCVAAAGQPLPRLPAAVRIVRDTHHDAGPLAGLIDGLVALGGQVDAALVCGCDVPLLMPALAAHLFERLGGAAIAVAHDGRREHPLPAVYRCEVLPQATALFGAGRRSLQALLARCPVTRVPADELRPFDPTLGSLRACNTVEQYRRALAAAGVGRGESPPGDCPGGPAGR